MFTEDDLLPLSGLQHLVFAWRFGRVSDFPLEVIGMMLVVVAYDVSTESEDGKRRLRRVAKVCEDFGQRVQKSVFECLVDAAQWVELRARLIGEIEAGADSLRFYFLGDNWHRRVEQVGAKISYDPQGPLII
jgi:CRISPR-associated protein Cas2